MMLGCSTDEIMRASRIVIDGGVVVYPTDTVYGVGCDPFNDKAVQRVYDIKERKENPLPVLCNSMDSIARLVDIGTKGYQIGESFWPGPLTIVAPLKNSRIPSILTSGKESLAVRIPNLRCTLDLITACGGHLVGTSANRSGASTPVTAQDVKAVLDGYDVIVDGGETNLKMESTIIEVIDDGIKILREGSLSINMLGI